MDTALLLEIASGAFPDRRAIGPKSEALSLGELAARANAASSWLDAQGVGTIVQLGVNGPTLPIAIFAAGVLGRPFAPLNYRLQDSDLRKLLTRTAPSVAIVDDDMLARVDGVAGVEIVARSAFESASKRAASAHDAATERDSDVAVMLFTSGTTGEPKCAILRHSQLASYVISTVEFMAADEAEASLISVPPYHIAGIAAVLTGIYGGRRIVHLPAFTPEAWVETAIAEQITHAMLVPTMLGRVLDVLDARKVRLPHLKALSYGGGPMPLNVIERALRMLPHVDFVNAYGLTETSSTISLLGPADHRVAFASDDPKLRRRLRSVGRPLATVEVEIRGPDGGVLAPEISGEVYVRGAQVAGEYLAGKITDQQGWFPTKDSGWIDGDGYLFLEGRLDDVIVRGGENISPGEIEDVLREHPAVADAAIVGVPDEQWGEGVAAAIVPKPGASPSIDDLRSWVKGKLRSTKTPMVWEFREALPYNETGKLLRRLLKAELSEKRREVLGSKN